MNAHRIYWRLHVGGWLAAIAVLFAFRYFFSATIAIGPLEIVNWLAYAATGIFLTHRLRLRILSGHWLDIPFSRVWFRYLAAILSVAAVLALQVTLGGGGWRAFTGARFPLDFLFGSWINAIFLCFIWTALYVAIVMLRRYGEAKTRALSLELAAKDARLQNLQAQVNPHFLFNGLNSVRALIAEDPAKATEAITWLSSLLRYSLRSDLKLTVPLSDELEIVKHYLALEKLRFEDRLTTSLDAHPATLSTPVPPLLLQSLVENAVKHGISSLPAGGHLALSALPGPHSIEITVHNSGTLAPSPNPGIGLQNARERLHLLYGPAASLSLSAANGRVTAALSLPDSRP